MKVTNQNGTFFIPDDIAGDPTKTVEELLTVAIPWEKYETQQKVLTLQTQIQDLKDAPDEILIPNPAKEEIPQLEIELQEAITNNEQWQQ